MSAQPRLGLLDPAVGMPSTITLRDYQHEAVEAILAAPAQGWDRVLAALPTGAGKTIVFASVITRRPGRALVLAHRDELITQAADKIRMVMPGADIGIVKAQRNESDAAIVVASVQSLSAKRLATLGRFETVVVDEAHHAPATSYGRILTDLGAFEMTGAPLTLGVTATPERGDKLALGRVFQKIVFRRSLVWMIAKGYLSDVRAVQVHLKADFDALQVRKGDYIDSEVSDMLSEAHAPEMAARAYLEHAAGRRALIFTPTVALAYEMAEEFRRQGIPAEGLDGTTNADERRDILARLRSGETAAVANAAVLCLDEATEILTDRGWVGPDAMTYAHRVANWDQGRVTFIEPQDIVVRDRAPDEAMFILETPRRSVRVTSRHRMLYRTTESGTWFKSPVDDLVGRTVDLPTCGWADAFPVAPADVNSWAGTKRRVSANAYNLRKVGWSWDASFLEAARRDAVRTGLRRTPPQKLSLDECQLIGFWVGDGSACRLQSGGIEYVLSQSKVYPHIIAWVDALLGRVGLNVSRKEMSNVICPHVRWSLCRGTGGGSQERLGVYGLEPYLNKGGSPWLWGLNEEQFEAFLRGWWYADGDHGDGSAIPKSFRITCANTSLLDLVQAIGAVRGWTTSVTVCTQHQIHHAPLFEINLHRKPAHHIGGRNLANRIHREQAPWVPERVWCVKTDTKNIITRRRGTVTVMGNTEGYDEPAVDCIVVAKPTRSRGLYCQMVGRSLRLFPGKADALIIDLVGSTTRHDLVTSATLLGLDPKPRGLSLMQSATERSAFGQEVRDELGELVTVKVELFRKLTWVQLAGGRWTLSVPDGRIDLAGSESGWNIVRYPKGQPRKLLAEGVSLEWAQGIAEEEVRSEGAEWLTDPGAPWRKRPAKPKQVAILQRKGLWVDGMTAGEASDALTRIFAGR